MLNSVVSFLLTGLFLSATSAFAVNPFSLQDMNGGGSYSSSNHPNSVFLLEFFQWNCGYCHDNAPNIEEIAEEFRENSRVQVLDVGIDRSDSNYSQWITRHKPKHPVLKDADRSVSRQISLRGTPTTVLLDCNHQEILRVVGAMNTAKKEEIKQRIRTELFRTCSNL